MMKIILILLLTISCIACVQPNIEAQAIENTKIFIDEQLVETENKDAEVTIFKQITNAQIVIYDDINQRYFVTIDSSLVCEYDKINKIANEIAQHNIVESKTCISFFSDSKWANYKDILFEETDSTFSSEEYQNWKNIYYLGEFDFESRVYQTYPASTWKVGQQIEI